MTPRWDEDLQPTIVGDLGTYDARAEGKVRAAPVIWRGSTVAYLYFAVDSVQNAAGLVGSTRSGYPGDGWRFWGAQLQSAYGKGLPAAAAVMSLLGVAGPESAGRVGDALEDFDSRGAIRARLEPEVFAEDGRRLADLVARADRGVRSDAPTRERIDAVLRGEQPSDRVVAERIAQIDQALSAHPTREPVLVALTRASARIPGDLVAGVRVVEPGYLTSYLVGTDEGTDLDDLVVRLLVPAGVPALYQEPSVPGSPGVLLLARGIEWQVERVIKAANRTLVTARVVGRLSA